MRKLLLSVVCFIFSLAVFPQQEYDNEKVKEEIKTILSEYSKTLNAFITYPPENKTRIGWSKKLKQSFESTAIWVYNDLDSTSADTDCVKMFQYLDLLTKNAPRGSKINLDLASCKIDDVIENNDRNGYTVMAHVKKNLNLNHINEIKEYQKDSITGMIDSTKFTVISDTFEIKRSERLTFHFKLSFYGYTYKGAKVSAISKWKIEPKFRPLPDDEQWWINLSPQWQELLRENARLMKFPDKMDIQKIEYIYNLDLTEKNIESIAPLAKVKQLRTLKLSKNPLKSLDGIENNKQLAELYINDTEIRDLSPLSGLSSLQILHCRKLEIESLDPIKNNTNLIELDCAENLLKDISALKNMNLLEDLDISLNEEIESIEPLRNKPNLKRLVMQKMKVTDLKAISTCYNMVELDVFSNEIGSLESIRGLKKIMKLNCGYAKIPSLSPIAGFRSLTKLECQGNAISDISVCRNFYALKHLNIARTSVSDLSPLNSLEYLQRIDIFHTDITVEEKDRFKKKHPKCKILYY